jgi:hypothetical protein
VRIELDRAVQVPNPDSGVRQGELHKNPTLYNQQVREEGSAVGVSLGAPVPFALESAGRRTATPRSSTSTRRTGNNASGPSVRPSRGHRRTVGNDRSIP